jgi:oligopeptidase B
VGEFDEFGNAKDNKDHFDYIYSYAPYNNIKKDGLPPHTYNYKLE